MPEPDVVPIYSIAFIAVLPLVTGCPDPEIQEVPIDDCVPFGDDEVGECDQPAEEGEDDDGSLGPAECVYYENPNVTGYRIQCEGEFHTAIDFHIAILGTNCNDLMSEDFCAQVYSFGPPNDTYDAPDVMACCGEAWDPAAHLDVYQDACMQDLAAQACASVAKRLANAIEAGDFDTDDGDFTDQATNLQAFIANHFVDCAATLYNSDSNPDPGQLISNWHIPNKVGPHGWWPAQDIVLYVEAGTTVVEVHRPEKKKDWLECNSAFANNEQIFEGRGSDEGWQ